MNARQFLDEEFNGRIRLTTKSKGLQPPAILAHVYFRKTVATISSFLFVFFVVKVREKKLYEGFLGHVTTRTKIGHELVSFKEF